MSLLAKSKGEVTYKELSTLHKWALVVLISMGSSIIYAPMYLKNVFYDPLMQALGATNAYLGLMVSAYGIAAMICYLPSGIVADKFRMRTLAWVGFIATAVLVFVYAMLPLSLIHICRPRTALRSTCSCDPPFPKVSSLAFRWRRHLMRSFCALGRPASNARFLRLKGDFDRGGLSIASFFGNPT